MEILRTNFYLIAALACIGGSFVSTNDEDEDADEAEEDEDAVTQETQEEPDLEGDLGAVAEVIDEENVTIPVDRSDEEWVTDAVLDVAFYLRSHKFNDFDRRYLKDTGIDQSFQYRHFPDPPLRYLHWEVYKNCEKNFYDCLAYLHDTVLKADLLRSMDTNFVMHKRHWEFPRNAKSIEKVDAECRRLKGRDWRDADPFKGPLERFQWRVSASYYMCSFSMLELAPLIMFGERCDNFATCLDEGRMGGNGDPRADDSEPYGCALYSFCPDVCCPARLVRDADECLDDPGNPCGWHRDRQQRRCTFKRELNRDLDSLALNQWNVSCLCGPGFQWQSAFGMCVDVDECSTGSHNCSTVQTCLNLQGRYACVCAWGYVNESGVCTPNDVLAHALDALYHHHHRAPSTPPSHFSLFHFLTEWTTRLFPPKSKSVAGDEGMPTKNKTQ